MKNTSFPRFVQDSTKARSLHFARRDSPQIPLPSMAFSEAIPHPGDTPCSNRHVQERRNPAISMVQAKKRISVVHGRRTCPKSPGWRGFFGLQVALLSGILFLFLLQPLLGQVTLKPTEIFQKPGAFAARDLYKKAHEIFSAGDLDGARLIALRIYFDGYRSQNLLDLLGAIEIKANHPLLAGEWLRKALCLNPEDTVARKILARLPPPPRPIPVEPSKLADHFAAISRKLPQLLNRLTNERLHFDAVLSEIERGQFYKALALSEEYEKRYPGIDGGGLTALCAFYLGRGRDALQLVEQGLKRASFHPLLLFVKAMAGDKHPETFSSSRAKALFDLDRWKEAVKVATQLTHIDPRSIEGQLVKARIALEQLQVQTARTLLDDASKIDGDNPLLCLLRAELSRQENQPGQASEELRRAFRRGYNMPSVNLTTGLMSVDAGRPDEGKAILGEVQNSMPFLDRDAYPLFVRLAIQVGSLDLARRALDDWKTRLSVTSSLAYCEALYQNKAGDPAKTVEWAKKALALNPNRLVLMKELANIPAVSGDPQLNTWIHGRLKAVTSPTPATPPQIAQVPPEKTTPPLTMPTTLPSPLPEPTPSPATPAAPPIAAPTTVPGTTSAPTAPPAAPPARILAKKDGPRYSLQMTAQFTPDAIKGMEESLNAALDKVETFFGVKAAPLAVLFKPTLNLGSRAVRYDFNGGRLEVSTLCLDQAAMKTVLDQERPDLDPDQMVKLLQSLSGHTLAEELCQALVAQHIKGAPKAAVQGIWAFKGLGEIVANETDVLHDRLLFARNTIASGEQRFYNLNELNRILNAPSSTPAEFQSAMTQAYLMVSFLLKRDTDLGTGVTKLLKMLQELGNGKAFDKALTEVFQISQSLFESGWKESGYWSLQQGVPYEW